LRSSHLLILAVIVLLLLVVAGFLQTRKWGEPHEDRAAARKQLRASQPGASGREHCQQKCAAIHKGYVYRARQDQESAGSSHVDPESCSCV
jgi:hypothetical protein